MKWRTPRPVEWAALDPYIAWAQATAWRGYRRVMGQRLGEGVPPTYSVRLLVQAESPEAARVAMSWDKWEVAPIYKRGLPELRHFVAEIRLTELHWLQEAPPAVLRWELAMPRRDADTAARAQVIGAYGETRATSDFRSKEYFAVQAPKSSPGRLKGPVMAIIDFGCPFMNSAFLRTNGTTRVEALWDQGAPAVPPPMRDDGTVPPWPWADAKPSMAYGRLMRGPTMNKLLLECRKQSSQGQPIDEAEAYRRIDYLINYDDARQRVWTATHGSHVLGIAGGRPDPLVGSDVEPDAASEAPLVFVQLPSLTAADSSGSSLSAQVLDAVRFVTDVCDEDARIVVVLSYGSFAGPHDGSSLIEQALDEIVEKRRKNLAIVLGAGNGRQAACHAQRSIRLNRSALLRIHVDENDSTDTFVETWFSAGENLLPRVLARARTSGGDWSDWIGIGQEVHMIDVGDARSVACLSFQQRVPNGERPLLLLALAPTARPADDDGPLAPAGSWQIELKLQPAPGQDLRDADVLLDSWIERDDPGWLGQGAQPRFEEQRVGDDEQTLSSLATGKYTIAAGGFRLSDAVPAVYSSTGRRKGPKLVYAACEESGDQPNICSIAVRSNDSLRMNGTSVAAPVLARRIYNWLAQESRPIVNSKEWERCLENIIDDELTRAKDDHRDSVLRKARPA